jgi:ATP-binding cassette subfamily C protein CydCD
MSRFRAPELGPGGVRAVLVIGVLSALRAVALVLIAESLAGSIAALAAGTTGWRDALLLGATGALLRAATSWAISATAARESIGAKSVLRRQLAERVAAGGAPGDGGSTAVLATSGLDDLDEYYGSVIPAAVSALVVPLVVGARILSVDWPSAVIIAVTVPLIPLFMILIGMHTRDRADAAASSLARLTGHLVELARGLPVLVGLGRVEAQTAALDGVQREWRERTSRMLRTAFLSALALELIATLSVALVAVVLGLRLLSGGIGLQVALLVLLLAPECFAALREVGSAFHSAQDGRAALRRARELLGAPAGARSTVVGPHAAVRGLSVRYPDRAAPALSGLDVVFPIGEITAVTAPSGGGKSTLLAALAGTLDPSAVVSGQIIGVDPERVAYVAQAPAFFGRTVGEEVELWSADAPRSATDETIATDAMLGALGLEGMTERRISELSPGEQRRLAIARAAVRVGAGATLVLLDEPTAHLDPENAAEVRAMIRAMRRTAAVALVSHDAATIGIANRVVALHGDPVDAAAPAARADELAAPVSPRAEPVDAAPARATGPAHPAGTPAPRGAGVLRALIAPARGPWALAILLGVAATGFGLALTAVSAWLIVRAAEHPEIMYLSVAIVGVRFFGLGRSVARYAERLVTHTALFAATDALRLRVWRAIAARGAGSRRLLEGGSAIDYLVTSIDQLRELVPRVVTPLIVGTLSLVGVVVTVALVDPAAAPLIGVVLVAGLGGALALAARVDRSANGHRVEARALLVERFAALADAAPELHANGLAARAVARVVDADAALAADDRRVARSAGLGAALLSLATAGLAVLVPVLAGAGLLGPRVPAESVAVVALLALASIDPLGEVLRASQRLPALRAVLARLQPFASEPEVASVPEVAEPVLGDAASTGAGELADRVERLEFEGLAAHWPGTAHPVFAEVEARVDAGDWLIVEGPSGAGKSTLLSILLGALAPSAGTVRVDGRPLSAVAPADWRRRVAWCPQDAHVFDSTIRGNLLLGRPRADAVSDGEMHEVLARVGLGDLLARLPDGLGARVGASGGSLSGGERQRLAVARALLGRSQLLLLDEPTAHLDAPTAAAMMSDLRAATRDRIVVLVTHRAEDRRPGDRVVQLRGASELVSA